MFNKSYEAERFLSSSRDFADKIWYERIMFNMRRGKVTVRRDHITGCLRCLLGGNLNLDFYPHVEIAYTRGKKASVMVHRLSWIRHFGPIPIGLWVLHRCDIKRCIEPKHLFLGTPLDNTLDMFAKERQNKSKGEDHYAARLSEKDVLSILSSSSAGSELAEAYGVSGSLISAIRCGHVWKHLRA